MADGPGAGQPEGWPPAKPPRWPQPAGQSIGGASPQQPPSKKRRGRRFLWGCSGAAVFLIALIVIIAVASSGGNKASPPASPGSLSPTSGSTEQIKPAKAAPTPIPPIKLSGTGQQATSRFTVAEGLAVFRSTCSACKTNFIVTLLDSSGQTKDLLVNAIGTYNGSKGVGMSAGSYRLTIQADSAWTITITQPRHQAAVSLPHTYSGKGDRIVGPFTANHAATLRGTHRGKANFIVTVLDAKGDLQNLPFNQVGNFNGSTVTQMISGGPYYLNVTADGTWTLKLSKP
ncbi:hypothetical protein FBY35_0153 [Streptomyces sp. SLBN-118]|uniref:hypothetical protein n=1 Tax=Streptomyces sp. SLBN-118 TaxID=2768454 RepID=UPI00115327C2|nr:hypothetical protein [Streptomyces sp. SLBN-118]TQK49877.1 hypothetical protein FBY35_0153 [Streptomyces sp. SLBN-118]